MGIPLAIALASCSSITEPDPASTARVEVDLAAGQDSVTISIYNLGPKTITHAFGGCTRFLEKREAGAWGGVAPDPGVLCPLWLGRLDVPPAQVRRFGVDVSRLAGEYRANLVLSAGGRLLPEHMRVSGPFRLPRAY